VEDWFPVKEGDALSDYPKKGKFARDFWGQGEKISFAQLLKGGMAVCPNRGRGRGRGEREEEH
jgi:hypothetical protein